MEKRRRGVEEKINRRGKGRKKKQEKTKKRQKKKKERWGEREKSGERDRREWRGKVSAVDIIWLVTA